MTAAVKDLLATLGRLSTEERADVAYHLLESLDEPDDDVASSWDAEVARRLADVDEGRVEGRSADEVFARLRDLYP